MIYFYGADGNRLMELEPVVTTGSITFDNIRRYVYFGRRQIRVIGSSGEPIMMDRLGSVRREGTEDLTYFPYGEEGSTTDQNRDKFATYYRDEMTALDYAHNRYYSSAQGRFTRPDPDNASWDSTIPQSLNRYAYVAGDPANRQDPLGLRWIAKPWVNVSNEYCEDYEETQNCIWVDDFMPRDPVSAQLYNEYVRDIATLDIAQNVAAGNFTTAHTLAATTGATVTWTETTFLGETSVSGLTVTFESTKICGDFFCSLGSTSRPDLNNPLPSSWMTTDDSDANLTLGTAVIGAAQAIARTASSATSRRALTYAARTNLQRDAFHNFPYSFDQHIIDFGTKVVKPDGYIEYTLRGWAKAGGSFGQPLVRDGVYEIGKWEGEIVHRVFVPAP